jgi:uridine phosphorylase
MIPESELILNGDGSIYHLKLQPADIADNILLVGDPSRVNVVSKFFDAVEFKMSNREFVTHTGTYRGKRISVMSTGIGCDNIDIVINELDALVNIDLHSREIKKEKKSLNLVRIGTSGSLQKDIPVDSFVFSSHGLGLDGLLNYYSGLEKINETKISEAFMAHTKWNEKLSYPYVIKASSALSEKIRKDLIVGITATAPGFYGPQGRELRLAPSIQDLNELLTSFSFEGKWISNFEMETSALYGLSAHLGHQACTVCLIIANRIAKQYSRRHLEKMDELVGFVLDRLTEHC